MLSFFPRGVLDEILNLIESVSEGFPSYSFKKGSVRGRKKEFVKQEREDAMSTVSTKLLEELHQSGKLVPLNKYFVLASLKERRLIGVGNKNTAGG